jgi:carbon-monoxide dehydrogenase small subunit
MRHPITVTVNAERWDLEVEANDVLLDVLRTRLGVKSPKIGCERGDCGTCTVLLDDHTVRACLILAVEVNGHSIVTVEGIRHDGPLTRLQQLFLDHNSFQCGFCAPGIILAADELLSSNPRPTRLEVQHALAGNLCRCTGYEPIIAAVLAAAEEVPA